MNLGQCFHTSQICFIWSRRQVDLGASVWHYQSHQPCELSIRLSLIMLHNRSHVAKLWPFLGQKKDLHAFNYLGKVHFYLIIMCVLSLSELCLDKCCLFSSYWQEFNCFIKPVMMAGAVWWCPMTQRPMTSAFGKCPDMREHVTSFHSLQDAVLWAKSPTARAGNCQVIKGKK